MNVAAWAQGASSLLALISFVCVIVAVALMNLKVDYCPLCSHCKQKDALNERRRQQAREDMDRKFGLLHDDKDKRP